MASCSPGFTPRGSTTTAGLEGRLKLFCLAGALAIALAGCVTSPVDLIPLNAPPHRLVERPPASIEVYASSPPTRPHVDIALLRAKETSSRDAASLLVQDLLEQAAKMGCDALFLSGATEHPGSRFLDFGTQQLSGTCIAYSDAPGYAPTKDAKPANVIVLPIPKVADASNEGTQ